MTGTVGWAAPDFELRDQHGHPVRLSSYHGQMTVALLFYPYAFSRVCTGELDTVRDRLGDFQSDRVQLLAISCDPTFTLRAFADAEGLAFPLLSDFWPHGAVATAYDAFDARRGCARRATVVVDRDGLVRWRGEVAHADARDLAELARTLTDAAVPDGGNPRDSDALG